MDLNPNNKFSDTHVNEVENQELQSALEQLAEKKLPHEAQAFFVTELYIQYGQNAKAIAQLEFLLGNGRQAQSTFESKGAGERHVEVAPERRAALERQLQDAKLDSTTTKARVIELLNKTKLLYSYDPCGQHGCSPNQRAVWTGSAWVCVGC